MDKYITLKQLLNNVELGYAYCYGQDTQIVDELEGLRWRMMPPESTQHFPPINITHVELAGLLNKTDIPKTLDRITTQPECILFACDYVEVFTLVQVAPHKDPLPQQPSIMLEPKIEPNLKVDISRRKGSTYKPIPLHAMGVVDITIPYRFNNNNVVIPAYHRLLELNYHYIRNHGKYYQITPVRLVELDQAFVDKHFATTSMELVILDEQSRLYYLAQ